MTMNVYHDGKLIASRAGGERKTSRHVGTIAERAIDDAISMGYSVEWQGKLYGDDNLPRATAEVVED